MQFAALILVETALQRVSYHLFYRCSTEHPVGE